MIEKINKKRLICIGLVVLGLILTIMFSMRVVRSYLRIWQTGLEPGMTNVEAIRGWMTIPYIAKSYGVPEEYIFEQLDISPQGNRRRALHDLNQEYMAGDPGEIIEDVQRAIEQYQAKHGTPTPLPTPQETP